VDGPSLQCCSISALSVAIPHLVLVAVALFAVGACRSTQQDQYPTADAPHPADSMASAALLGRFAGTLPCADCGGIRTELKLYTDPTSYAPTTYELQETYLATRDGDRTLTTTGRWTIMRGSAFDNDATIYQLDFDRPSQARNFLKTGDWALLQLDREQALIQSSQNHTLTRMDAPGTPPVLTVTAQDVGRPLAPEVGQELAVKLTSNHSTGYSWALSEFTPRSLAARGEPEYVLDAASRGKVGAGGVEIWRFVGIRTGQQTLHFVYRRPWENAPPAESASFDVTVQPRKGR